MTSPAKPRVFFAAVALLSLQLSFAQTNVPDFFAFGPPSAPVWDLTGTYDITNQMQAATIQPTEIVFKQVTLNVDGHGKISGSDNIIVLVGDGAVGGGYRASGKISGGGTKTRVNLSIRFTGNGTVAGVFTSCNLSANYNLTVNPVSRTLVGKASGSARFSHLGNGSLKSDFSMPLLPGVDGSWNVTLDVIPFGNKVSGSGLVEVANTPPSTLSTRATGNLSKQTGKVKVKLSGSGFSSGTQLKLEFLPVLGADNQFVNIDGKVLGQKVKD
jgi:hypothetical protein